jgi:hypothetical protein
MWDFFTPDAEYRILNPLFAHSPEKLRFGKSRECQGVIDPLFRPIFASFPPPALQCPGQCLGTLLLPLPPPLSGGEAFGLIRNRH